MEPSSSGWRLTNASMSAACGRLTDEVGHIDGEEITRRDKSVNRCNRDVVGIHMVRQLPAKRVHRCVSSLARRKRLRTDDGMFAIRLVPHGYNFNPAGERIEAGLQLRLCLMCKAVAGSNGIFMKLQGSILLQIFASKDGYDGPIGRARDSGRKIFLRRSTYSSHM